MSQLVARHMVERGGGGKIVFISSVHTKVPWAQSVAYNAAKSGLNNMALTIATELVRHRINVNVIEPGWIDTPQERETFGDSLIEEQGRQLPWGRLGRPEEIGKLAAFLCSEDADYMTGSIVLMDGGIALKAAGARVEVIA
jgi:glucose 1-dehydrogenase